MQIALTDDELSYVQRSLGARTDAIPLERQVSALSANTYEGGDLDDLAIAFIEKGMKKIDDIPGRANGKRVVLGFSFQGGDQLYLASLESAELAKVQLGPGRKQYLSVNVYARNAAKKILRMNIPVYLDSWDKVKCDYRAQETPAPQAIRSGDRAEAGASV